MTDFFKDVQDVGETHVVSLRGELDMATAEGLSDWLVAIAGSPVVVDLSGLTFMDSTGITALVMARKTMTEDGNELILSRPPPMVERVLQITGLSGWLTDWDPRWESPSAGHEAPSKV
jgi:anti-anti-sigma factor